MTLPAHKTKIVCTIGPASESPEIIDQMIRAGMNVARLNFSHGDFSAHGTAIDNIRSASKKQGKRVAVMADLPGPKMRIGQLDPDPVELNVGDPFILTSENITGTRERVSMSFHRLPQVVRPGDRLFLNDGIIEVEVIRVDGNDVQCRVVVGGELRSRKGLNLPGIDLGISAFTDRDHECLKFALEKGVDAVSQSFVERASDIEMVREAAKALGHSPLIIAKIERAGALMNLDEILKASDAVMIARGDLGVEIPIEQIAIVQKRLMKEAMSQGKPVITATQMLESMVHHSRPTRAEATDVANAILDGTDCVMLSGESAMGKFPVGSVSMLARIAAATEPSRSGQGRKDLFHSDSLRGDVSMEELIAFSVCSAFERSSPAAVFVPTMSGATARNISRFKIPVWITAVSPSDETCQKLQFSYGVYPLYEPGHPADWNAYVKKWVNEHRLKGTIVLLTEGPSSRNPDANNRMEIIDLK